VSAEDQSMRFISVDGIGFITHIGVGSLRYRQFSPGGHSYGAAFRMARSVFQAMGRAMAKIDTRVPHYAGSTFNVGRVGGSFAHKA
jgi:hypothetical protein